MPTPARNLTSASDHTLLQKAASRVNKENQRIENISVRARPNRSAIGPQTSATPQPTMKRAKSRPL